jgi:hypothetical protein
MNNNKQTIGDFVVVAGTEGFTDIKTGEVHDVATMLTSLGFTSSDLAQVQLTSRLVRPLLRKKSKRSLCRAAAVNPATVYYARPVG